MMSVLEQVKQITSDLFLVPLETIHEETSPATIEQWDSLQHLNLVLALEEVFDMELTPEDMEQMSTVGAITQVIETKLGAMLARTA